MEDIANVRFRFENGRAANVTASRHQRKSRARKSASSRRMPTSRSITRTSPATSCASRGKMRRKAPILGKLVGLAADAAIVSEFKGKRDRARAGGDREGRTAQDRTRVLHRMRARRAAPR